MNPTDMLSNIFGGLTGQRGLETAAAGARDAQKQANALADLQWQRQMMGLQEARGQTQPYLSLYDKIYGTHNAGNVAPVAGLGPPPGAGGAGGPPGAGAPPPGTGGRIAPDPNRGVGAAVFQIGGGRGAMPDNAPFPQSQRGVGESILNANSHPIYSPVMTGRPPGTPSPAPMPVGTAPTPYTQPTPTPVQSNGMNAGLAQLLAALGMR